jgi:excisionase family DNA binding protein
MSDENEYLNAVQAAEYLGVRRQRVYELVEDGRIGRKIAGYWVFTTTELDAYKAQKGVNKGGRPPKINSAPYVVTSD